MVSMSIKIEPVAFVSNARNGAIDDQWKTIISIIRLADHIPTESLEGISLFSHLEIVYQFHKVNPAEIVFSGRPRGNPVYPLMGIFAQRKKDRPNAIGITTVELIRHEGRILVVRYLDAIDGTPVIDIKPCFREFQPQSPIVQPTWVSDLMKEYW